MKFAGDRKALVAGMWLIILGALLVGLGVLLVVLIERRSWLVAAATGGSLIFLGVLLVTLALPSLGAGEGREVHRNPLVTAASLLFYFSGLAALASFLPLMLYMDRTGELPILFGEIKPACGALFERLWVVRGVMVSMVPFAVLGVFEILAGTGLWRSLQIGGALGLWLTPFAAVFLFGYGAPYYLVIVPLRVILVALAWSSLT